eukprot:g6388.t1
MEQLIGRAKFSAKCVKNEIHNILTTLRLTRPTHMSSPQAKFHMNSLKAFQQLFEELTYMHELHEFDIVAYVNPFLEVIQSDATSGELTAVALEAVDKFVSFGLVHPESPKSMEPDGYRPLVAIKVCPPGGIFADLAGDRSARDWLGAAICLLLPGPHELAGPCKRLVWALLLCAAHWQRAHELGTLAQDCSIKNYWLTAATDNAIRVWDLENKQVLEELSAINPSKNGIPWCVSLSWNADGTLLFAGSTDGNIYVYRVD